MFKAMGSTTKGKKNLSGNFIILISENIYVGLVCKSLIISEIKHPCN